MFWVQGLGLRVWDSGLKVWGALGLGCKVHCPGLGFAGPLM